MSRILTLYFPSFTIGSVQKNISRKYSEHQLFGLNVLMVLGKKNRLNLGGGLRLQVSGMQALTSLSPD